MPTPLIIVLVIILIFFALIFFFFYRPVLKLNREANGYYAEIEDNLALRADLAKKISFIIKDELKDSNEIISGFFNSEKIISKAINVSDISQGDALFINTFYKLLTAYSMPNSLKADYTFCNLIFNVLKIENNLKESRMAYNSIAVIINKKLNNPLLSKINKIFCRFPIRQEYELGNSEKSKISKLLKINYE